MYRDIDEIQLGETASAAIKTIRDEIAGLRRLLAEAEARAQYWQEHWVAAVSSLSHHLDSGTDPCGDRGVTWPCDVACALNPQLAGKESSDLPPHTPGT